MSEHDKVILKPQKQMKLYLQNIVNIEKAVAK